MVTNLLETKSPPCLKALDKLGFCTFPVFENNEVEQLLSLYHTNFGEKNIDALYASHNSNPVEQSLHVSREIKKIVNKSLQSAFPDYEYFLGHFMVKGAKVRKEFSLHQDWNIVDESKYKSYQVWIPLQLSYPANGGMFVVPGSHKFFGNYRSGSYEIPVVPFDNNVKTLITNIIVPKGNVLVYHNGLFHASYPNTTDEIRIAVIANFVEKRASTFFFHKNEEARATELYEITGESLISNLPELEKGIIDNGLILNSSIPFCKIDNAQITSADLVTCYEKEFGKKPAGQIKQLHITMDDDFEQKLNEDGYTVINLLNEAQVAFFKNEYNTHFGNIDRTPGRFTTLQNTDAIMKRHIHDFIVKHIDAPLRKYFKDFIIPVSQFYTKKAHTSGDIDLHADSTLLLNHHLEPHYAIWIPLIDVDATNGTLTVIPRSHLVNNAFFSGTFACYHQMHLEWLRKFELPITLKAGQAVIFDNNTLHNSTANQTDIDRLCFTFRITHEASQYYSLVGAGNEHADIVVHEEDHNFYMDDKWDGENKNPNAKYAGTLKNSLTKISKEELQEILKPY